MFSDSSLTVIFYWRFFLKKIFPPCGRHVAQNLSVKWSDIGRGIKWKQKESKPFNPFAQGPMPNLFLDGSSLSGYFLCYTCRKQIIDIRFANITSPAANSSSVLRRLSSPLCHYPRFHLSSPDLSLCCWESAAVSLLLFPHTCVCHRTQRNNGGSPPLSPRAAFREKPRFLAQSGFPFANAYSHSNSGLTGANIWHVMEFKDELFLHTGGNPCVLCAGKVSLCFNTH